MPAFGPFGCRSCVAVPSLVLRSCNGNGGMHRHVVLIASDRGLDGKNRCASGGRGSDSWESLSKAYEGQCKCERHKYSFHIAN